MEWQLCRKTEYEVAFCKADAERIYNTPRAGEVYNFLEDVVERIDRDGLYVCRGTLGELYLVPEAKMAAYEVDVATLGGDWQKVRTKPQGALYFCRKIEGPAEIDTAYGTMHANRPGVVHGDGDRLLCMAAPAGEGYRPLEDDCWVVNGAVFANTYRLL